MKKILAVFMAAFLCGSCAAERTDETVSQRESADSDGAVGTEDAETEDKEEPAALARELSEQMAGGVFASCAERFSDSLRENLDEAALRSAWEQVVSAAGDYVGFYESSVSESGGGTTVVTTLEYTGTGVTITLVLNEKNGIEGIWLNYRSLPVPDAENDSFTETAVQIGEYRLNGVLTLPADVEQPPVAILIQGSGQSDYDESVGGTKPFRDLAHGLAERGIASVRYNKRFYQCPEAGDDPAAVTIRTEVLEDVNAAIRFAEECGGVNGEKIFLIGHSLGGMLAPAAAGENPAVSGIVSLAGSPRRLEDIICSQYEFQLRQKGLSEDKIEKALLSVYGEAEGVKNVSEGDTDQYFGVSGIYWYSLNQIDSAEAALSLEIPMLFLQGSADMQIYADIDYTAWQALLADRPNCRFRLFDGLGHLFIGEEGTVDEAVTAEIAAFIHADGE